MRVILYKRVSTDEQANKGFSLGFQDDILRSYCKRMDYTIVGDYIEDFSGKNFERPEYKKMFEQLKKESNSIDLLIVSRWDRFGRNIEFCLTQKRLINELGIELNAVEQPIGFSATESGIMMLSMYLAHGQADREGIVSRTSNGSNKARRNGYFLGRAPYGYRRKRTTDNKASLDIFEEEATFVRQAFEEVALGIDSVEAIFKRLFREGMNITKQTFYRMFLNPTYCGRIHVTAHLDLPEEIVEGKHDGIISVETYLKAQAKKTNNRWKGTIPKREKTELPLRNFLKCPVCDGNLTGSPSKGRNKKYYYYHCRQSCPTRVQASVAHSNFICLLEKISIKAEYTDLFIETLLQTVIQYEGDSENELRRLRYELKSSSEQLTKLDQQLIENRIPTERYNRLSETLEKKIGEIKINIIELEDRKKPNKENLGKAVWIMSNLSKVYESADYKGKRKLLAVLFPEKIILEKDKCRTTLNNEVLALIASISASFQQKKSGTIGENSKLYRFVHVMIGLSNQIT